MKRTYVVRVVVQSTDKEMFPGHSDDPNKNLFLFVEQLRYAGLVHRHNIDTRLDVTLLRNRIVFDILPPAKVESKVWAKQVSERMQTFGYNAEVAPKWEDAMEGVVYSE